MRFAGVIFLVALIIALIVFGPIFTVWSVNLLFHAGWSVNLSTWAAVLWFEFVLGILFQNARSSSK